MFKVLRKIALAAIILIVHFSSYSQIPIDATWGKGIRVQAKDSSFAMKFSFRFQSLYTGALSADTKDWRESMMIRRSRLKFDGYAFDPSIKYKVELGVSNRDSRPDQYGASGNTSNIILDAVVKWGFSPGWELWFGQTKLPGNRERVISSQKLQFVDRSLVNGRFNLDRGIGVQLRKTHSFGEFVINEIAAISMGEGRDIIISNYENGREYTGRIELLPFGEFTSGGDYFGSDLAREESAKLSVGFTYDFNHKATRSRGNLGEFVTDENNVFISSSLTTIIADAIFKFRGLSVASEYAHRGSSDKQPSFGYGSGFTVSGGYLFKSNFELGARYTTIASNSPLSSIDPAREYLIGVSKYIVGHSLKIQSDVSFTDAAESPDFFMVRLQCEVSL